MSKNKGLFLLTNSRSTVIGWNGTAVQHGDQPLGLDS